AVRSLMEGQHKAMLKRLVAGEFNELAERLSATHYDPGVLADGTNTASYVNTDPSAPAAAKTYAKKPAPAKPVTPIAKPAAKPQQPVWQPAPPSASPPSGPAADGARHFARVAARGLGEGRTSLQRHAGRSAARRSSHAVCRGADQREEPRRSHPCLSFRGPRAAQVTHAPRPPRRPRPLCMCRLHARRRTLQLRRRSERQRRHRRGRRGH